MALAFCVEIMGLPTLAFAVGLYLPIHLGVPIMVGGLVRLFVERGSAEERAPRRERGVLYSSGLIAGAALVGVFAAALAFFEIQVPKPEVAPAKWTAVVAFLVLTGVLVARTFRRKRS